MKKKIIKVSFILLILTLVFTTSFNLILKDKSTFSLSSDEYMDYVEVEFLEIKEEEEFNEVYFVLKNKTDYYMVDKNLKFTFNEDYNGVYKQLELSGKEKSFYKEEESPGQFYVEPNGEKIYFVEVPKDMRVNVGYEGKANIGFFLEVRLYLLKINENTLYNEIFMMSTGERIEVDPNLFNN